LSGRPYTVVGVRQPGFEFPGKTDIWQLLAWNPAGHVRSAHFMESVGRLAPGTTLAQAEEALAALTARLEKEFPRTNRDWGARVVLLEQEIVGYFRPALLMLFGAVALLLALACANVANLLLARAAAREKEVALRATLGAGRGRLVRQFLTESFLLALGGALVGLALAAVALRLLVVASPLEIPRLEEVGMSARVFGFSARSWLS
jgi:putative ABC transport system permease protein